MGKRKPKPTPLSEPEWGRHRRGARLHAWQDQTGTRYGYDENWKPVARRYDRVTLCGLVDVEGHERPSRRGRRCLRCLKHTEDPRSVIGNRLAAAWPRGVRFSEISSWVTVIEGRVREALRCMEVDKMVWRTDEGVELWTARRALVEAHGGTFGMGG